MELEELQRHWEALAQRDALWSILTVPGKRNGRWDLAEFFRTGEDEIRAAIAYTESVARPFGRRRALDFGCGVGRLTQALCGYFDRCDGVDVAPSMIALAERFNRHPDRCRYYLNARDDLGAFADGTFDFVYSNIVLQHMRPALAARYIAEIFRVLAPSGVLLFQVPSALAAAADGYDRVIEQVRAAVDEVVPAGEQVVVISKGDDQLLALGSRAACHFPHTADGVYIGHHPADAASAIALLEQSRERGARFLVVPAPAFWWLEHYAQFREHLDAWYRRVWSDPGCIVYELERRGAPADPGLRARIAVREAPRDVPPGAPVEIAVSIENVGTYRWPGRTSAGVSPVRLGNHWLDPRGAMLVMDDTRTTLPADVAPGQVVDLTAVVTVPAAPGEYVLELDLVQDGAWWFKDVGSETVRVPVSVRAAAGDPEPQGDAPFVPRMEMYGIPRARVIEIVGAGNVVDVQRDESAGPEWLSFRYCVQKPEAAS